MTTITLPEKKNKPMTKMKFLMNATALLKKDRPEFDLKASDWFKILYYMHSNGWLYATLKEGQIDVLVGGYRVKDVPKIAEEIKLPENEEGEIFYIAFYVPRDKKLPIGAAKRFFQLNKDIKQIVFENNNEEIRQHKFIHRGDKDVTEET